MSYPRLQHDDIQKFSDDLLSRKEFIQYATDESRNFRDPNEYDALSGQYLRLRSHQLFTRNLINPNTPYKRLLLQWKTGVGKTLGAMTIANEFINIYQRIYRQMILQIGASRRNYNIADKNTPSVFVIGFTKLNFIKELLKYPEFGYISIAERAELDKLQSAASTGGPDDVKNFKDYYAMCRRRITNKNKRGFYKFFGYQEFVNRLFISETVTLTDLESQALKLSVADNSNAQQHFENIIKEKIDDGTIQINVKLLERFENSLLICDEIHNTYNSHMKNSYGVAIQYVLDSHPNLRAIMLTATPLNNSPKEIVNVLNYILPSENKVTTQDLFESFGKFPKLKPDALKTIANLSYGRVSFIQDINPLYYPEVKTAGNPRKLRHTVLGMDTIPYIKFIECPMSTIHLNTYREFLKTRDPDSTTIAVPTDSYTIIDMVFPNPKSKTIGLYRSTETRAELSVADADWKIKNMVRVSKKEISGQWLRADVVGKYYSKLAAVAKSIDESFKRSMQRLKKHDDAPYIAGEKMLIYHERVRMAGVLLIGAFMRENNIIDEYSEPVDGTRCACCGGMMSVHDKFIRANKLAPHTYNPARFVLAHSDVDKGTMLNSLDKYNLKDNSNGTNFRFLIGSKIIRESYDIKDTESMHILSKPINISGLNQLRGRVDRHGSHLGLPADRRTVTMHYYLTTVPDSVTDIDTVSAEEYKYMEKLTEYKIIQTIERVQHEVAIDGNIHREIIMPAVLKKKYFGDGSVPKEMLGPLYFDHKLKLNTTGKSSSLTSFNARGYGIEEIATISYIIRRLFASVPVWTYDNLWKRVQEPPFGVEANPKMFVEHNFAIALNMLTSNEVSYIDNEFDNLARERPELIQRLIVSKMFDPAEKYVYVNEIKHKVEHIGDYYIVFAVNSDNGNRDIVETDIESYMRKIRPVEHIRLNLDKWVNETKSEYNYDIVKAKLLKTYLDKPIDNIIVTTHTPEFYRKFLSEIIEWYIDETDVSESLERLYIGTIGIFDKLGAIIYIRDIIKYKDTAKKFKNPDIVDAESGRKSTSDYIPSTPVGYVDSDGVHLYDSPDWIVVSKVSMNLRTQFTENQHIVGNFDIVDDVVKFKLRRPLSAIRQNVAERTADKSTDTRIIERGIVCGTKNKNELIAIAEALKINLIKLAGGGLSKPEAKRRVKIKMLCRAIKKKLLDLEISQRIKDTSIKYVYMWYEDQPLNALRT